MGARAGKPRTSVVIATYRRCSRLRGLIKPLLADAATHEVIVVIDGCRDGSLELMERLALEDRRVVGVYQENAGAAAARAAGVRQATGEIVLLLDDDVIPEPNLVTGHAARHAARAGLVVVGYMPVDQMSPAAKSIASVRYSKAYESHCNAWETDPDTILRTLWAGNFSLSRADALRIGLQGPTRLGYNADRDFGIRCRAAGMTAVFDRSLRARHEYERSLAGLVRDAYSQGRDLSLLQAAHPDVVGPLRRDRFTAWLPRPVATLLDLCRRRRAARIVAKALFALATAAGALRLRRLQALVVALLVQVERQRGAIEVRREREG